MDRSCPLSAAFCIQKPVYASSFTTRAARVRGRSTDFPVRAWTRSFISTV